MKPLAIGSIKLKNPLILAPMFQVTNLPYRILCRKAGASLAYTEMVYIDALLHKNSKTMEMIKTNKEDYPLGIQVAGSEISQFEKAIPMLSRYNLTDINCGCPSYKITSNNAGAYMLKSPEKIFKIIKKLKDNGLTTTAKIRLGFKTNNAVKIAKEIEKAGADAITIHARLAKDDYSKRADWNQIRKVRRAIGIAVIGNGDILKAEDAKKMLEIADGAMIARGAIGNPFIFKQALHYIKTGKNLKLTLKMRIKSFWDYIKLCEKNEFEDMGQIKHIGCHFITEFNKASNYRNELMKMRDIGQIKTFIKSISP